jgi:hypothetical protein
MTHSAKFRAELLLVCVTFELNARRQFLKPAAMNELLLTFQKFLKSACVPPKIIE